MHERVIVVGLSFINSFIHSFILSTVDLKDSGLFVLREEELQLDGNLSPFKLLLFYFGLVFEKTRVKADYSECCCYRPRPFNHLAAI